MDYAQLKAEVRELIDLVNNDPENNTKPTGWRIMYSPVMLRPKVLLMGINPGAGMEKAEIDYPNHQLEYLDNLEKNYQLAGQTVHLFDRIGKIEVLKNETAKTNCHYFVSKGMADFKEKFKAINVTVKKQHSGLRDYLSLSHLWNRAMIFDIIDPNIVICEGKAAYEYVLAIMPETNKPVLEKQWDGFCGLHKAGNKFILGYARRYSTIKNINRVSELLDSIL